uniref:Uncharacterized protein n=1 Tax=Eutreptiella gymnastica TaxID=73025 RepID=A0A7S4CKV7_9EUGL
MLVQHFSFVDFRYTKGLKFALTLPSAPRREQSKPPVGNTGCGCNNVLITQQQWRSVRYNRSAHCLRGPAAGECLVSLDTQRVGLWSCGWSPMGVTRHHKSNACPSSTARKW